MANHTKGPWKAKRLSTYQDPGWVVLWPDKGGAHMRRLDSAGNFTGPDAALIAAAPELLEALRDIIEWFDAGDVEAARECAGRARRLLAEVE